MTKNYRLFIVFLFLSVATSNLFAQSTNPSPYCYPTASSMTSGTCTYSSGFNLQAVKLNTLSQSGGCYGSSNSDVYRYWSSTTTLKGGGNYVLTVTTPYSTSGYNISAGAWIDYNQNNRFEPSELIGADLVKNNTMTGGNYHNLSFTVPCSATNGKTRMRVRSQYYTKVSSADTCSCPGGYGETWDFDVTIVQPTSVNADFIMPAKAYEKTVIKFINKNANEYSKHAWDVNNDGTWEQNGTPANFSTNSVTWTSSGTKCVKLRTTNCFGSDSVVKCISVSTPTAKPVVGFTKVEPCEKVLELYGSINLIDTSDQGPYIWYWNIYDSVTFKNDPFDPFTDESSGYVVFENGTNRYSQSPQVSFYREGIFSVELIATNGVGTSKITKKSYIKVISPITYFLGFGTYGANNDNRVASDFGRLFDDGGPNNNYGNNQGKGTKSFLIINPAATRPITLRFEQLKLKNSKDSIKIYDDDKMDSSKLLAVLTSANNGSYPSYTSTLNKMYFYFSSDASDVDSGFKAQYTNTGVYQYAANQKIAIGHNLLFVNGKSVFYNENQNEFGFNFNKVWSVNDTVQTAYNNMDTFQYKFKYAGTQKVCLEMKNCDTTFKQCENLLFESGLMGVVYKDNNSNCAYNSGDKPMSNIHVKLFDSTTNSWSHYYTNALGEYNFNKGAGTYKAAIDASGMPFRTICATPGTDSFFRLSNTTPYRVINFDIGCKSGHDIGTQSVWTNGIVFPGRKHELHVSAGDMNKWFGLNCTSGLSGSVVITVSGNVSYVSPVSGALTPTSVSGKVFTYSVSDFSNISNNKDFGLIFKTDTSAKGGDTISVHVKVTPLSGDIDTTNNTFRYRYRVSNSYDPNMKEVHPDELTDGFKDWLTYTIHFQNTGNAPAFDIRLQDTLDSQLDPETFQLMNYSHSVSTVLANRVLSFKFKDIMLPDSNSDEKGSHGFVQFRIKPKTALTKGSAINNKAFIYFDYNEPVVTNTATNNVLPKGVYIPDPAFAAWLTAKYPSCMYKGNLMDTACTEIKKETSVDVSGKGISNLFGIQFFVTLNDLNCSYNQLVSLPALPSGLTVLKCANNQLNSLPAIPSMLDELDCSNNNLTSIAWLPSYIQKINCSNNQLSKLPVLAATLKVLHCEYNQLTALPYLFSGLKELYCNNNAIFCFDNFSVSLSTISIGGNNNKCLPNYISAMDAATKKVPLCLSGDIVNNPDNCKGNGLATVLIPDVNFAAWLSAKYPAYMYNGNRMDTSSSVIKNEKLLDVSGNNIVDLSGLQFFASLETLNCSDNLLTTLPALPVTLQSLNCEKNSFVALPSVLPAGLSILRCGTNQIKALPILPGGLDELYCNNNKIICFEKFADKITAINISANSNKCLPNHINAMDATAKLIPVCIIGDKVNNPDDCPGKPMVGVNRVASASADVIVYPNPANGLFNIVFPAGLQNQVLKVQVYNVLGELIYTATTNNGMLQIDITQQLDGVYLLKIEGPGIELKKALIKG